MGRARAPFKRQGEPRNPNKRVRDQGKDAFTAFGEVSGTAIIKDKFSGERRGFGGGRRRY